MGTECASPEPRKSARVWHPPAPRQPVSGNDARHVP
jgi:hypothetical protein